MNKYICRWLLCLCSGLPLSLAAQVTVFPGDASNNGIVNNVDVLYIGYSFGTPGPSRVFTDAESTPQQAPANWTAAFPDGTNYAHADADGDGLVNVRDLLTVYSNYGAENPPVIPDVYPEPPDNSVQLKLEGITDPDPIIPGSAISIPLLLNEQDRPVEVNGLAFSLEFDPELISEIRIDWSDGWFTGDSSWYSLQTRVTEEKTYLDIALTRFGNDPITGGGEIGQVYLIIEEDLVGLLPAPSDTLNILIELKKILAKGRNFEPLPVLGDDLQFTVHHPDARNTPVNDPRAGNFTVFPNPAKGLITIKAAKNIRTIWITDLLGRQMQMKTNVASDFIQLPLKNLPSGLYLVRVQTEEGFGYREILVE
ncbi:MAG: T9SS type A sorting domain-containing protein [Saprospiraceae bacterium]